MKSGDKFFAVLAPIISDKRLKSAIIIDAQRKHFDWESTTFKQITFQLFGIFSNKFNACHIPNFNCILILIFIILCNFNCKFDKLYKFKYEVKNFQ